MPALTQNTMSFSDIYGAAAPGKKGGNAPGDSEVASGKTGKLSGSSPAISWLGLVAALVLLRVAWNMAK